MDVLINKLLSVDNEQREQATADLKEALKRPETVPALCDLAVGSPDAQVRQYAAVLLKKHLGKLRHWQTVAPDVQDRIRQGMLQAIPKEPIPAPRKALTQFVAVLVRHEFGRNSAWEQQMLAFVFENIQSADPAASELGAYMFDVLTDLAPDQFIPHLLPVCKMFEAALLATERNGSMTSPVVYHILLGMSHLVPFIIGNNAAEHTYSSSVPYVLKSLNGFAHHDDANQFIAAFDILDNLADEASKLISPHLRLIIEFCLAISADKSVDESVRVKTITYIGWLVRQKKKMIIKEKLVQPIITLMFDLMSVAPDEEDEEEEYFGDAETSTPSTCAAQTLDMLALHIPAKQLIPTLLELCTPALAENNNPVRKKAAFLCLAVIAEGCAETLTTKYLRPMLDHIKAGIVDETPLIRNAALFALGQFSEHLQPQISQFADEILPILFNFLQQLCSAITAGAKEPPHIDRVFYALETYCENLEDALTPYLPQLMERLLEALQPKNTVHLRELVLSAISSTAAAAKEKMEPYFSRILEELKMYLVVTDDEDIITLRPNALDTLAALIRETGKDLFLPIAADTMNVALQLLTTADDPDLRRSCYNIFASIASVVHEEMASAPLDKIVNAMLESVRSTEGIVPTFRDGEDGLDTIPLDGSAGGEETGEIDLECSENEDEEEDDEEIAGYSVENAYLDEKEEAIVALKELALHTGAAFAAYIHPAFEEIYKLINYPKDDVRSVSIEALAAFVIALHKLGNAEAARKGILMLLPKYSEIIRTDEEREVVQAALVALNDILLEMKEAALTEDGQKDAIFGCITDVLEQKVACQFNEAETEEEEESEMDEAVVQAAGDVLPRFGLALEPQEFAHYFNRVYPYFVNKIEKTKNEDETADSQRAFAIGVLSECFGALKSTVANWIDSMVPMLFSFVEDRNEEVRNNTIFGLGELILHGGDGCYKYYPQVLTVLSNAVASEKDASTLDNICGALARLILANPALVPLPSVLPVFVQYLPLRKDFSENLAVFRSLAALYQAGNETLASLLDRIAAVGIQVLKKKEFNENDETQSVIFNLLKQIQQDFPDKFNAALQTCDPETLAFVQSWQ